MLGLDIDEIPPEIIGSLDSGRNLRHSRRIAQQKIKEEAEIIKEISKAKSGTKSKKKKKGKDKEFKLESKKKTKLVLDDESDEESGDDSKSSFKKKKKKKEDLKKLFSKVEAATWKSSTDSSSHEEEDEDEEISEEDVKEEPLKSDHEFSPESDLEGEAEARPIRRARTVKKESDTEEPEDDHACQKCSKTDHPETILLCDKCDCGWHCSCLRPALLVIPEGEWFCPPCEHIALIEALKVRFYFYLSVYGR